MSSLKSLVILKKGFGSVKYYSDNCLKALVRWIFSTYDMGSIERVWIQDNLTYERQFVTSSVKSFLMGDCTDLELGHDRFRPLEHLGGLRFSELAYLPNLRYVSCDSSLSGVRTVFYFYFYLKKKFTKAFLSFYSHKEWMNSVAHIHN